MIGTVYMNEYSYNYERIEIFNNEQKRVKLKYKSKVYLKNLDENTDKENYLRFHLDEKNIKIFINDEEIDYDKIKIFSAFSSLELFLSKENFYLMVLNLEEINSRINTIEKFYEKDMRYLEKIEEFKIIVNDEWLLFKTINDNRLIKLLFSNLHFKKGNFSGNRKGFYLENFVKKLRIPVIVTENKDKNKVEITGEINSLIMSDYILKKELEKKYNLKVKSYKFKYKLNIYFENEKIREINEGVILIINEDIAIKEEIVILGET